MSGAIPPLLQYAFMAWCLVKHRDNFTLPLPFKYVCIYINLLQHQMHSRSFCPHVLIFKHKHASLLQQSPTDIKQGYPCYTAQSSWPYGFNGAYTCCRMCRCESRSAHRSDSHIWATCFFLFLSATSGKGKRSNRKPAAGRVSYRGPGGLPHICQVQVFTDFIWQCCFKHKLCAALNMRVRWSHMFKWRVILEENTVLAYFNYSFMDYLSMMCQSYRLCSVGVRCEE
jgi:hypothetical protein